VNTQPASTQTADRSDQRGEPWPAAQIPLPMHLLDACGSGYTAEDLARVLGMEGTRASRVARSAR
jgi:hypothetical protein